MPSESVRSLYIASACDLVIAASKFVAAAVTGSSAMISEGIHHISDACNGVLLLWGRRASGKAADATHPFGYGKELYFWSLLVTILIFAIGGGMSIYQGLDRALHEKALRDTGWNYFVLGISAIFEAVTVRAAIRDFRKTEGHRDSGLALRLSKDPSVITVLLENIAALVGLAFASIGIFFGRLLNIPSLDGVASILIGLTLVCCI